MKKVTIFLVIIFIMIISCSSVSAANESTNLIKDFNFEDDSSTDGAYFWTIDVSRISSGISHLRLDNSQAHTGVNSFAIANNFPNYARIKQTIKVKGNTYYKLSCFIKTESVGMSEKGANISVDGILDTSTDIKGTNGEWEYVELYGKTNEKQDSLSITLGVGGYGSENTGKAWFDDVVAEELSGSPADKKVANFYSEQKSTTTSDKGIVSGTIIASSVLLIAFIVMLVYFLLKGRKNFKSNSGKLFIESDIPDGNQKLKIDKKDLIIMASMTVFYAIIALYNLGSTNVPETSWKSSTCGENFVIDLGKEADLSRIYYYNGLGEGKYSIEYADRTGKFHPLGTIDKWDINNVFIWRYIDVSAKTSKLRVFTDKPATLNELGIFENGSREPLKGIKILSKELNSKDEGKLENLFDEQGTIEYKPSFMTGTYFDELCFARTAYEQLHHLEPFEWDHPPLGKIFISIGIVIFGMNPFGWRIIGTLFGVAMIPLMYLFGKKLFEKRFYGFCAAFLMMFDFMHFVQTRVANLDVYTVFFIILIYYYMYDYFMNNFYTAGTKQLLKPLFFSGLFFGIGAACKWIALYSGAGIALLFFISIILGLVKYKKAKQKQLPSTKINIPIYINKAILCCLFCVLFFAIIPIIIYALSYIPYMMVPGHSAYDVIKYQNMMLEYHSITALLRPKHPASSEWWSWPFMVTPILYYTGSDLPQGTVSNILAFGNPAIWWISIFALIAAMFIAIYKKSKGMVVVLVAAIFQYAPWIFIKRSVFIYHFFSVVPFVILSIVYIIKTVIESSSKSRYSINVRYGIVGVYLGIVALLFLMFYPILSGMEVSRAYVDHYLNWFDFWPDFTFIK